MCHVLCRGYEEVRCIEGEDEEMGRDCMRGWERERCERVGE